MFKLKKVYPVVSLSIAMVLLIFIGGCKKDADTIPANETTYNLMAKDVLGVSGTATFIETSNSVTTINLKLNGAPAGTHPAELRMNSATEGGMVISTLNSVDDSGSSSTLVSSMSYSQLIAYDGFIRILKSSSESDVILAQGDIGGNVITDSYVTYILDTIGSYGVSGTALFEKRVNGNTLVTLTVLGVIADETYPASINLSSISTLGGGPVVKLLNNVDGTTGKGYTNIRSLDSGVDITYENWLNYDGYINIYKTSVEDDNIISHGNIGSN